MSNKNPTHKFAKGNKLGGRKPLPDDLKLARNLSYEEMCRTVIAVRKMKVDDVKSLDMDELTLGLRAIMNAYVKLDYKGINYYEDRLWGKAKETIDLGGPAVNSFAEWVKHVTTSGTPD